MSDALQSALSGVVVAVITALVAAGVLGGADADAVQTVVLALLAFGGTVGVRSARGPRKGYKVD